MTRSAPLLAKQPTHPGGGGNGRLGDGGGGEGEGGGGLGDGGGGEGDGGGGEGEGGGGEGGGGDEGELIADVLKLLEIFPQYAMPLPGLQQLHTSFLVGV